MSQKAYTSASTYPEFKSGSLRLYSARFCPYAQRSRLVLAHKNIPHELINIDLKDKPEWFLKKTPPAKVPTLEYDDGKIIYESTAVSEFLDDSFPGDKLQSDDPYWKAKNRILLEYFGQLTSLMYSMYHLKFQGSEEELGAKVTQFHKHFQFYEDALIERGTPYFGGDKPGMIDFFLWPHMERVPAMAKFYPKMELSKSDFPKFVEWWQTMTQLPAVKKEMRDADFHSEVYKRIMEGKRTADYGLDDE